MSIYVASDIHGCQEISKISRWNKKTILDTRDVLIICGDFGLIFNEEMTNEEKFWLNWFEQKKFTTIFIDGNHDNLNKILDYPVDSVENEILFGKFHRINKKVLYSARGNIFLYKNDFCLTIGGASSIDKSARKEGVNWWKTELISDKQKSYILEKADNCKKVKYVFSHACPINTLAKVAEKFNLFQGFNDPTTFFLEEIRNKISYDKWYCGHYHQDFEIGKVQFVYDKIIKIGD